MNENMKDTKTQEPETQVAEVQIPQEYAEIINLERNEKNWQLALEKNKEKLMRRACDAVRNMADVDREALLARTIAYLLDEKLADCYTSAKGRMSLLTIIDETLRTGLELGKHAYAVPQNVKSGNEYVLTARYDVKREGFHVLLCGGKQPIFRDLRWGAVFEEDKCDIDAVTGDVTHKKTIGKTRGDLLGVWVQATKLNLTKEVEFYPVDFIYNSRDQHSKTWQSDKASPWKSDPVPMAEKTAIKAFCRPWANVKDALAAVIYEGAEKVPAKAPDIETRAEEVLGAVLDNTQRQWEITAEAEPTSAPTDDGHVF